MKQETWVLLILWLILSSFLRQSLRNVAQTGLKLKILLPQPPKSCDYRIYYH